MPDCTNEKPLIYPESLCDTLPDEYLLCLGKLIFCWGRIQWHLANLLVVGFSLQKNTGLMLACEMGIATSCKTLRNLISNSSWINDSELQSEIRILAGEILNKAKTRNIYAHGVYGFDIDHPNDFFIYKFKNTSCSERLKLDDMQSDLKQAKDFVNRISELSVKLKKYKEEHTH